jgi:large subunit ribosomal protein L30e
MVAEKKAKKSHEGINSRLALVMKSGKYTLGYKSVLKSPLCVGGTTEPRASF